MNNLNPIVIELLKKRGITEESDIAEFLSEKPRKTYDPFLLSDMEAGVDLILSKIKEGVKICIYGDYDADGITSIALLYHVLSNLTDNLVYYIPSRFDEGYGLNKDAIQAIKDDGAGLIVTVDCGSVSYDEVEYAKQIGMEIVVTDHHSITDKKADCLLINPKRSDCNYPFKNLAGVGVSFKVAQALQQRAGLSKAVINEVLDLVAIGTIGDIVPLVDENRTMVKYGLAQINRKPRKGIEALIDGISLKRGRITSENIAFAIVPHINAAGRMLDAKTAAKLLISEDDNEIRECVEELIQNNRNRKNVQEDTYKTCVKEVDDKGAGNFILINSDEIHEGIAGIVAGKLKEKYERPAIIVTPSGDEGGFLKGTGRSIEKINLYELLKTCDDLFEKFGGHAGACGFLMKKENLDEFVKRINDRIEVMLENDNMLLSKERKADLEVISDEITIGLAHDIERLAPFGSQNPKPVFKVNANDIGTLTKMGQDGQHARFTLRTSRGPLLTCVMFNGTQKCEEAFSRGNMAGIYGTVETQVWNGTERLQLIVSHIEI